MGSIFENLNNQNIYYYEQTMMSNNNNKDNKNLWLTALVGCCLEKFNTKSKVCKDEICVYTFVLNAAFSISVRTERSSISSCR